jgi:hypothetical protein
MLRGLVLDARELLLEYRPVGYGDRVDDLPGNLLLGSEQRQHAQVFVVCRRPQLGPGRAVDEPC